MADERLSFAQKILDAKQTFIEKTKKAQLKETIPIAPEIQDLCLRAAAVGSPYIDTKNYLTTRQKIAFADHFYIHLKWLHHNESTDLHKYEFRVIVPSK